MSGRRTSAWPYAGLLLGGGVFAGNIAHSCVRPRGAAWWAADSTGLYSTSTPSPPEKRTSHA